MSDAVIGTEVDGYRIQSVLGRGGMGTVYKAEDVNLSRTVAIKRINPGQQERESFIHRFRSEAQALARIDSPQIVGVYALRETDIGLLIVMEYVEGGTLKDPLDRQGALAPTQAVPILDQTLKAFDDAHSAGVIHRDIKPENIMLTQDGMVKVTDFGIAKLRQPDSGETVTQGGQGGTLKYMSPEQISSIDDVDARSDVYSLGMTAYEILAGDLPFEETDTDFDIMRKIVEGKIPPPDELNPDIPSGLAQWVVESIRKEQEDRYQSAEAMQEALHEADQQASEQTVTQPGWEVDDEGGDVDQTQTAVPGSEDHTQTVVPGEDEPGVPESGETVVPGEDEDGAIPDPGGQTVMDADPGGATQPAVPEPEAAAEEEARAAPSEEEAEEDETNWTLVGGGVVAALLILVGGYVGVAQLGGDAGATATLSLTAAPEGAVVLVNGDTAGTTPISSYSLREAGPVMIEVRKEGYSPLDTTVTVEAGGSIALQNLTLAEAVSDNAEPANATLAENTQDASSTSSPDPEPADPASEQTTSPQTGAGDPANSPSQGDDPDAGAQTTRSENTEDTGTDVATGLVDVSTGSAVTVFVDGERQSSGRSIPVPVGEHTIKCRHQKHGPIETTVSVTEGKTETLSCYFEREVKVTTLGPWGRVWLNRSDTGKQTPANFSLGPGTHRIEVRRKTLDSFSVEGGVTKTVRGGESQVNEFEGRSYQIEVTPGFTKVTYAVSFEATSN